MVPGQTLAERLGAGPLPGGRFLITQAEEEEAGRGRVLVVLNWFRELRRLAPAGR
jgi:hypothetical protein